MNPEDTYDKTADILSQAKVLEKSIRAKKPLAESIVKVIREAPATPKPIPVVAPEVKIPKTIPLDSYGRNSARNSMVNALSNSKNIAMRNMHSTYEFSTAKEPCLIMVIRDSTLKTISAKDIEDGLKRQHPRCKVFLVKQDEINNIYDFAIQSDTHLEKNAYAVKIHLLVGVPDSVPIQLTVLQHSFSGYGSLFKYLVEKIGFEYGGQIKEKIIIDGDNLGDHVLCSCLEDLEALIVMDDYPRISYGMNDLPSLFNAICCSKMFTLDMVNMDEKGNIGSELVSSQIVELQKYIVAQNRFTDIPKNRTDMQSTLLRKALKALGDVVYKNYVIEKHSLNKLMQAKLAEVKIVLNLTEKAFDSALTVFKSKLSDSAFEFEVLSGNAITLSAKIGAVVPKT